MTDPSGLRKRPLEAEAATSARAAGEIDIAGCATIAYSSEDPAHPVEHMLDGRNGPGATRWVSARPDAVEHIVIEFDHPQPVSRFVYEVEETLRDRTQEVRFEVSEDGAQSYRQILVQEYNFSPGEPPTSAKNSASISARSLISVLLLFQIRADPARHRLQRSASSPRGPCVEPLAARAGGPGNRATTPSDAP